MRRATVLLLATTACAAPDATPADTASPVGDSTVAMVPTTILPALRQVTGVVTLPATAMPADATVEVELVALATATGPGEVLGRHTARPGPEGTVPFAIDFDAGRAETDERTYLVRARVLAGASEVARSLEEYPVVTRGRPQNVTVVVVPPGA
jgi:uncharacterized lipoprotein YbaY